MTNTNIPLHVVFVEAWIKKGDKYLLAKRSSKDDQAAGKWAVPGGKVDGEILPFEDQDEVKWVSIEEMGSLLDDHWTDVLNALKNYR